MGFIDTVGMSFDRNARGDNLALAFDQELNHAAAAQASNSGSANSPVTGSQTEAELLDGQQNRDPNIIQAQWVFFRQGPIVGPLERFGPIERFGPMEEAPITSPKPMPPAELPPQAAPKTGTPTETLAPPVTVDKGPQEQPADPTPEKGGSGNKVPPNGNGIRTDGDCDNWKMTPSNRTRLPRSDGRWDGEPGNSNWHSTNPAVNEITGGQPVRFTNGQPNFTPWSKFSVNMPAGVLTGNHDADVNAMLEHLTKGDNPAFKSKAEARRFLQENELTPHHASDTCLQLVPTDLNGGVPHVGAASGLRNK